MGSFDDKSHSTDIFGISETIKNSKSEERNFRKEEGSGMQITFNSKTGRAKEVKLGDFVVDYTIISQWKEKKYFMSTQVLE